MKPTKNIEKSIRQLQDRTGAELDARTLSDACEVLAKKQQTQSASSKPNIWRIIMKSKIPRFGAVAAGLLIGLFLWVLIAAPTNITLADVQESINSKTWILIEYEDGRKEWYNLNEKKSFSASVDKNGINYCRSVRDHVNGLQRTYHSNWGYQIHEFSFTPKPFPQTPWEYVLSGWDDKGVGKSIPETVEKFSDIIEDREVIRFDTYDIGPLGIRVLAQQIWADPKTRLPVRIRENLGWKNSDYVNTFRTGDFSFPEDGPSNIFDLGAPQDLKVVSNWGIIEPEAKLIVDAAEQAWHNLPTEMRIIEKNFQHNTFSIYYRLGNKFRQEYYVPDDYTSVSPSLDPPKDPERLRQWAQNNQLSLLRLIILDGEYEYSYSDHKEIAAPFEAILKVRRRTPDWIDTMTPIRRQWPYINTVGPMKVLYDEPTTPEGCVLLRHAGADLQMDFHLDPERDYICIKQFQWNKDENANEWIKQPFFQQERSDLSRLPSGQWYAQTAIDERGQKFHCDVQLLTDADKERLAELDETMGFFDGEKLLKEAIDAGANITFWAR